MNIMVLIVLLCLVFKAADGYKKGMVKEIISFVSLIVICVVAVLVGAGLHSYMEKEVIGVVIAVLLLTIVGIVHHLLGIVFFSAKLISKLPIISWGNKLLGIIIGAGEVVLVLWTLYAFIMDFDLGMLGNLIIEYTAQSEFLTWIYEYNLLAPIVESVLVNLPV